MWSNINTVQHWNLIKMTTALLLLAAGVVGVNYLSSSYYTRRDITADQSFSLSADTRRVLNRIEQPIVIHFFPLPAHVKRSPYTRRNRQAIQDLLREYVARSDHLSLQILPPAQFPDRVRKLAEQYDDIKETELMQREPVLIRTSGTGEKRLIPFDRLRPIRPSSSSGKHETNHSVSFRWGEKALTSALYSLTRSRRITICTGGGQNDDGTETSSSNRRSFKNIKRVLTDREGFQIRPLSQPLNLNRSTCDVLLLLPATSALSGEERGQVRSYLKKGGSIIALSEPGSSTGLRRLFADYGINLTNGSVPAAPPRPGPVSSLERVDGFRSHPVTTPLIDAERPVWMRSMRVITERSKKKDEVSTSVLLGARRTRSELDGTRSGNLVSNLIAGERGTALPVAVASHRAVSDGSDKETKLVAFGDADWISDSVLSKLNRVRKSGNVPLFLNTVRWSAGIGDELRIIPEPRTNPTIVVTNEQAGAIFTLVVVLIPGCTLLLGTVIWWFRRIRT